MATSRSSPSCSPRIPNAATASADDLRDDLRRFSSGEQPDALRAIVDAHGAAAAAAAQAAAAQANQTTAMRGEDHPRAAPCRSVVDSPSHARRNGWCAPAAFLALVALRDRRLPATTEPSWATTPQAQSTIANYAGEEIDVVSAKLEDLDVTFDPLEDPNANRGPRHRRPHRSTGRRLARRRTAAARVLQADPRPVRDPQRAGRDGRAGDGHPCRA
ncbi:MAG: hypothetical protein WKF58_15795 [Ilumatobacteraceae bacterium]